MAAHVIFVGTYEVPPEALNAFIAANKDMRDYVKANEPRLVSWHTYISDDRTEATTIMIHPDSDSLEYHLQVAATRISAGVSMVRTKHMELYGEVSEGLLSRLQTISQSSGSWPIDVKRHLHGFPEWAQQS